MVDIRWDMNRTEQWLLYQLPLTGIFNIEAGVITKGEKVGAVGLEPPAS